MYWCARVDIWRDQWDRRSRKFFVSCVNFLKHNAKCYIISTPMRLLKLCDKYLNLNIFCKFVCYFYAKFLIYPLLARIRPFYSIYALLAQIGYCCNLRVFCAKYQILKNCGRVNFLTNIMSVPPVQIQTVLKFSLSDFVNRDNGPCQHPLIFPE